jgi:hypothetical protein
VRFRSLLVAAAALLVAAVSAGAAQSPGRCAAIKTKAAGGLVAASFACHAKVTRRGEGTTSACLLGARGKFERLFAKAERKGACGVPGDVATIGDYVAALVAGTAVVLFPSGSPDAARRCAAKKMQRAGVYGRGRLACWARAFASGSAVGTGCFAGPASKLVVGFRAAEVKPGCVTAGDVATVEAALDVFVDPIASLLAPTSTTTTTVVSTSTTSSRLGGGPTTSTTTPQASVSFSTDVQPIFTQHCALSGCHAGPDPREGLNLTAGESLSHLVNVASHECDAFKRVQPGDPDASYLMFKLLGPPQLCFNGERMPEDAPPLPAADIDTIRTWITDGAPNN